MFLRKRHSSDEKDLFFREYEDESPSGMSRSDGCEVKAGRIVTLAVAGTT